mmetsp:Transcript_41256/g.84253  ORF Transcript_41256/g.84253 Transcript_41256/m.84253 type:complete len:234 (-) Transcript_41256:106-807(-)
MACIILDSTGFLHRAIATEFAAATHIWLPVKQDTIHRTRLVIALFGLQLVHLMTGRASVLRRTRDLEGTGTGATTTRSGARAEIRPSSLAILWEAANPNLSTKITTVDGWKALILPCFKVALLTKGVNHCAVELKDARVQSTFEATKGHAEWNEPFHDLHLSTMHSEIDGTTHAVSCSCHASHAHTQDSHENSDQVLGRTWEAALIYGWIVAHTGIVFSHHFRLRSFIEVFRG